MSTVKGKQKLDPKRNKSIFVINFFNNKARIILLKAQTLLKATKNMNFLSIQKYIRKL